ncbi:MAG TPA: hypothetical protein VI503_03325 [Gaiellaceae bacterium]|nr:hypothetical protein [Gaiellaceae bacterium]
MDRVDLGVCEGRFHERDPDHVLVLLPGAHYLPLAPLLWFAREAAQRNGWSVLEVWYEFWEEDDWVEWVKSRARAALEYASDTRRAVVGKSMASAAAGVVADERLPAVWLTPLLGEASVVAGLDATSARTLLVGGTGDASWDGDIARRIPHAEVLELEGADHSLQLAGDLPTSIRILGEVTTAIDRFLAEAA